MRARWAWLVVAAMCLSGCFFGAGSDSGAGQHWPASSQAMAKLRGLWLSQIDNNAFQMRVDWNPSSERFEGYLARQGAVSQYVGFSVGELVWVAYPTQDPYVLQENQKYRYGMHGMSTGSKWMEGTVDLRQSGGDFLITNFAQFRKIGY